MRDIRGWLTVALVAFWSVGAMALPLFTDNGIVAGELSSLNVNHAIAAETQPKHGLSAIVTPWVSGADASSWPACGFALALMLREFRRVRVLGRHSKSGGERRSE